MDKIFIPVTAILTIGLIEVVALSQGIDGALLSASFIAIGGICGYWVKSHSKSKR